MLVLFVCVFGGGYNAEWMQKLLNIDLSYCSAHAISEKNLKDLDFIGIYCDINWHSPS